FHGDYLSDGRAGHAVTSFRRHLHGRRSIDTTWTLAALRRSLGSPADPELMERIAELEGQLETGALASDVPTGELKLEAIQKEAADALAQRLVGKAAGEVPGYLILNACGFARRAALELPDF